MSKRGLDSKQSKERKWSIVGSQTWDFHPVKNVRLIEDTQDEVNTIHSGEISLFHSKKESEIKILPPHVRYRLTVILEKEISLLLSMVLH